jgi:O-methyltransferase
MTSLNPIQPWDDDHDFNQIYERVVGHSLVDKIRCYMLYQLVRQVCYLPGGMAEIGVYKGGTARLIAETADHKDLHLFDTFSGMPPTDQEKDKHRAGDFSDTSLDQVKEYLSDCRNVFYYPGLFPETASPVDDNYFSFVHVDADIYQSVKAACEFFYPKLVKGGIMVFDDYGFLSCPGAKVAVDEYFADKEQIIYLPTGQAIVIKI